MASGAGKKIQWSINSTKMRIELKVLLGRLDVEKLGFEESEDLRLQLAEKKNASKDIVRIECLETEFDDKIGVKIKELFEANSPEFLYLLFQPTENKGIFKVSPVEAISSSLKILLHDRNIVAFASSKLNFGFLLNLNVEGKQPNKTIEFESWTSD